MTIELDRPLLIELMKKTMGGRVRYRLGAKAPTLDCDSSIIHEIDCSGYVRYLIHRATHGRVTMPDGSFIQRDWCKSEGFRKCDYADCAKLDSVLRIGFITPTKHEAGHVWMICSGQTIESRGGKGPSRRPWHTRVLTRDVAACYILTESMP